MTLVLPALHGYPLHKRPTFATLEQITRAGREVGSAQQQIPLWEFETTYEILRDESQNISPISWLSGFSDYSDLLSTFLCSNGQYGFFYFEDLSDNSRLQQGLGTGDAIETDFLFVRTITYGSLTYTEPVGGVNLDHSIVVYIDGVAVPQSGNWNISSDNRYLVFDSPPGSGAVVEASFYYYYLCRFITDSVDFEEFMTGRWANRSLRFRSVNRVFLRGSTGGLPSWLPLTPPPVPAPPSTTPPSIDSTAFGKFAGANSGATSISFLTDGQGTTLTTNFTNDLIVVIIGLTDSNTSNLPIVLTVSSSSGLVFTQRARVSAVQSPGSFPEAQVVEVWTAPASGILSNENITATMDVVTSYAFIRGIAIKGANLSSPIDPGADPPPSGANFGVGVTPVVYSTSNAYDLLFWITAGLGVGFDGIVPTGFDTGPYHDSCFTFFGFGNINGYTYKRTVTSIQVSQSIDVVDRGVGILLAISN